MSDTSNKPNDINLDDLQVFDDLAGPDASSPWFNDANNLPKQAANAASIQKTYDNFVDEASQLRKKYKDETGLDMPVDTAMFLVLYIRTNRK